MATKVTAQLQLLKRMYPWIKTPLIINAPMRIFAAPALATAVYHAGGSGSMAPGAHPSALEPLFAEAKRLLNHVSNTTPLPIGIGFQTFSADLESASLVIEKYA